VKDLKLYILNSTLWNLFQNLKEVGFGFKSFKKKCCSKFMSNLLKKSMMGQDLWNLKILMNRLGLSFWNPLVNGYVVGLGVRYLKGEYTFLVL
jgi:hypothetical protein